MLMKILTVFWVIQAVFVNDIKHLSGFEIMERLTLEWIFWVANGKPSWDNTNYLIEYTPNITFLLMPRLVGSTYWKSCWFKPIMSRWNFQLPNMSLKYEILLLCREDILNNYNNSNFLYELKMIWEKSQSNSV